MTLHAYNYNLTFKLIECCECKAPFMMTSSAVSRLKTSKGDFWCPYCKQVQGWYGNNKEDVLKKQLEAEKRGRELAEHQAERAREHERHAKNVARAQKAAKTRIKNRIKNGVCPCCNRTFQNLHKQHQHPEYAK